MRKLLTTILGVSLALLVAACSKPEAPAVSDPEPAAAEQAAESEQAAEESIRGPDAGQPGGSDPVAVDPDHYSVEFENDAVRVLRIKYGPGEESVMHYHPNSVAVFLTDIEAQMTMADGTTQEASIPAGTAAFNSAGEHLPRNTSDSAWEVVEIELKQGGAAGSEPGGPDPVVVDSDHYTAEFENDQVRILRIEYGPGEESVPHYHPDGVAVFLTDHLVQMTMPDGSTQEISTNAGDVILNAGGQHLPKNIADSAWELILVELK